MLRTSCAAQAAWWAVAATTVLFAQPSSLFFTETAVQDIHLRMDGRDWRALRDHYLENTYYPAEFQWQSTRLPEVSLRSYGNGSRNSAKPAFRIDFNRRVAGQEFIGLKSLILKNLAQDIPMLRERLAMLLFRRMNVPAPREAYVRLTVNGEFWGLYIAIEPIDKRFLLTRFGEDDGYLYQYKWTFEYDLGDLGSDPQAYFPEPFQPQTHESDPAVEVLMDWIHAISRSSDEEFESAVGRYIDFEALLTYLAVENYLGETDGFVGTVGVNNFYLCRLAETTQFQILPWDKDTTVNWAAEPPFWRTETNVLVRRTLAVPRLRRLYLDKLLAVADLAGGAGGWFENKAVAQFNLIRPVALADPHKPFSNEEFLNAFEVVRYFMQTRANRVREEVALVAEP